MNTRIIEQADSRTQDQPAPSRPIAVNDFNGQSVVDGHPVSMHVELAAIHAHEEICAMTGARHPWLQTTREHRNALRQGIIDLIDRVDEPRRWVPHTEACVEIDGEMRCADDCPHSSVSFERSVRRG